MLPHERPAGAEGETPDAGPHERRSSSNDANRVMCVT